MRFWLFLLLALAMFTAGCITTNRMHDVEHYRAWRDDLRELHENFDRYLFE